MARDHSQAPEGVGHVNVTPLIDVVMCLIIFFMLCGTIAAVEWHQVSLPQAANGEEPVDKQGRLVVTVRREAGVATVRIGTETVARGSLGERLRAIKAETKDLRVVVRADKDLPYAEISPVLVGCAEANVSRVEFATQRM